MTVSISPLALAAFNVAFAVCLVVAFAFVLYGLINEVANLLRLRHEADAVVRLGDELYEAAVVRTVVALIVDVMGAVAVVGLVLTGFLGKTDAPPLGAVPLWQLVGEFVVEGSIVLVAARAVVEQIGEFVVNKIRRRHRAAGGT